MIDTLASDLRQQRRGEVYAREAIWYGVSPCKPLRRRRIADTRRRSEL